MLSESESLSNDIEQGEQDSESSELRNTSELDKIWKPLFDESSKGGVIKIDQLKVILSNAKSNLGDNVTTKMVNKYCQCVEEMQGAIDIDIDFTYGKFIVLVKHFALFRQKPKLYNLLSQASLMLRPSERQQAVQQAIDTYPHSTGVPLLRFTLMILVLNYIFFVVPAVYYWNNYQMALASGLLIYSPCERHQIWRYLTYAFLHANPLHFILNAFNLIYLGAIIEPFHGFARIGTIYAVGAVSGALMQSFFSPAAFSLGASGAVYALFGAFFSPIISDWKVMKCDTFRWILLVCIIIQEVAFGMLIRSFTSIRIGHSCHFGGALSGLLISPILLRPFSAKKESLRVQLKCTILPFFIFTTLFLFAILFTVFNVSYFPDPETSAVCTTLRNLTRNV